MKKFNRKIDFNTTDYEKLKISELKRLADYWLRQYLLKKAKRNNLNQVWCPIKEKYYNKDKMQASHYIDRSRMCTRYDKNNVWLISSYSNMWDSKEQIEGYKSKHHKEFEAFLISKIGQKNLNILVEKSQNLCILQREDYIKIIEKFKNE